MEGIQVIIFGLVFVVWLGIWIIRMFAKAFDQPPAKNVKPFKPKPQTSLEEMLRQHLPKTEEEIQRNASPGRVKPMTVEKMEKRSLESDRPKYKSLEVLEPRRRSLETLEPLENWQNRSLSESLDQREDIVRRRQQKTVYQMAEKPRVSVYARRLQNPKTAREAIVLAEILKPKF